MKRLFFLTFFFSFLLSCSDSKKIKSKKPNIIIIYVDDLGYGDVGSYGAIGVETPNIDKLVANGLKFTDSHSSAATCTPSRFSLLTGSYAFRNKAKVLKGDAPLLIKPGNKTLPGMLQKSSYKTAVIGKWHLGLGDGNINWNGEVKPGPLEVGFDYSFLIPSTGDRVPCVYLENHKVVGLDSDDLILVNYNEKIGNLPTGISNRESLKQKADPQHSGTVINNISRIGYMSGGEKAWWVDEDFPEVLTSKAKKFIKENKENPFFLYLSYHDIHVPRIPNTKFIGKSKMGPRGDAIAQMDWCTGEILNTLEQLDINQNTLIIFSSDNGPVLNDGYDDSAIEKLGEHNPTGPYRGGKYSAYEGGTRVPTISHWPKVIKPAKSDALWSQVDIYASIAKLVDYSLEDDEAVDSHNMLDVILGKSKIGRTIMLEEAYTLSIRKNQWKYIEPVEIEMSNWIEKDKGIESGLSKEPQLYNLKQDIGEQNNLAKHEADKVLEMQHLINKIKISKSRK